MNSELNAARRAFGLTDKLDAIPKGIGNRNISGLKGRNPLRDRRFVVKRRTKCQPGQNRHLVSRIDAFDIESRIGFGITEFLCLPQSLGKRHALFPHHRQNKVARSVHNARNRLDAVGSKTLAQGFDNRDAAGNGRLVGHRNTALLSRVKNLFALRCNQVLIRRHNVFTASNGIEN